MLGVIGVLTGCALVNPAPPPPSPADSAFARGRLTDALVRYWRSVIPRRPDIAVALGRRVDALPSPTEALGDNRAQTLARRLGAALDEIDVAALSPRDYATLQTLRWELDASAEASTYSVLDFSLISPSRTPLRHGLRVLFDHPLATAGDLNRYLFLLDGFSFWLLDVRTALEQRGSRSSLAPVDAVRSFAAFLDRLRALGDAGAWRVSDGRLTSQDTMLVREFRSQEREAITLRLRPAIDTLQAYLEAYARRAMPRPGLWQYPGGKEYYRHLLRRSLGVEVEPEEAHRVALAEVGRIDSLLVSLRQRLQWTGSALAFHDSLRRSPRFAPIAMDSAITRVQAALALARDTLASRIDGLPESLPLVRSASPMEALLHPGGMVRPPEFADSVAVLALTPHWGTTEALVEGPSLSYRMNWPGAVLAATVSYSGDSLSPMVLLHPAGATHAGWAEYAASIVGELGLYADPLVAYGRLLHEGWNAALLLADTGVHYYGWSRQQALAVLRPWSLASDAALDSTFVETVVQAPGTAGGATIGAREYAAMRTWMQRLLGDAFNVKAWHAEVLSLGPVPLPVLAAHLEWWGWNERRKQAGAAAPIRR